MLNICFLGKLKFEWDGASIEEQLGAKAFALICLLILNKNRYLSREKIIGYLWPDSNEEAARYNLRYNLWLIKKNIGTDEKGRRFLSIDKECCGINKEFDFTCDILNIMKFKPGKDDSIESILQLKQLFRGDFLEGCYFNKCDEFNELIIFERINFEQRKVKILKRLVELYEKEKSYEVCLETINEILEIEPYDEEMVCKILDIYIKCGKRAAAVTYYNQFSNQLAGNLGIAPSDRLRNKYNEIRLNLVDVKNEKECLECSKNCGARPNACQKQERNSGELKLVTSGIKNVDFFWMAEVTGKLISNMDSPQILQLNKAERFSLLCIQPSMADFEGFEREIETSQNARDVCIVNAFFKLLRIACKTHQITILILESEELDESSAGVVRHLKRMQIEGLKLVEE